VPLSRLPGGQRPFPVMMLVMMELTCARSRYNHLFASIPFAKQVLLHTRLSATAYVPSETSRRG
jgi:hypothetical protein